MGVQMETLLGSARRYVPKRPTWRNGNKKMTTRAASTAKKAGTATGHDRSPELQHLKEYRQLRTTCGVPLASYHLLVAGLLRRKRLGNLLVIQMCQQSSGSIQKLKKVQYFGNPGVHQCLRKPVFAFSRPVQFGIFPKRLSLPYPDEEILSGYKEDVSSIRDGFSAWVKSDPETILRRHLVDAKGAKPAFREAQDRKHSPTNEEYRFDADVPNRLTEQKWLCIYNWNPGP